MGHPHIHVWLFSPFIPEAPRWCLDHDGRMMNRDVAGATPSDPPPPPSFRPRLSRKLGDMRTRPANDAGKKNNAGRWIGGTGGRSWLSAALATVGHYLEPRACMLQIKAMPLVALEFQRELIKADGTRYTFKTQKLRRGSDRLARDHFEYFEGWNFQALDNKTREKCGDKVIAGVYEAFEGVRLAQGSSGFLGQADALREPCACKECGGTIRRVELERWRDVYERQASPPRGPPSAEHESARQLAGEIADAKSAARRAAPEPTGWAETMELRSAQQSERAAARAFRDELDLRLWDRKTRDDAWRAGGGASERMSRP
jgi:hypothetical protein